MRNILLNLNLNTSTFLVIVVFFLPIILPAQSLNQIDNFQNGTLDFWTSGAQNPAPPINDSTGGPSGNGDRYMHASSSGGASSGGKLVIMNTHQWAGNYISAGIGNIRMNLKNEGSTPLQMRIAILSALESCSSLDSVPVPAGSGWITVNFPLSASSLTGGTVSSVLTNVVEIRLLHAVSPGTRGDPIAAQLGIDNITATATATSVAEGLPIASPRFFYLTQNYPNPFNPSTRIEYSLSAEGMTRLSIYNILGQRIALLADGVQAAGQHIVIFNAAGLSSGPYFYRLESGSGVQIKKMLLSK